MDLVDLTVSDDILCEIGRITVFQTHIERQMAYFIGCLLELDEDEANLITYRLSIWRLLEMLESLLYQRLNSQDEHLHRFGTFQNEIKEVVPERNNSVHSMWSFGETLKADSATRITYVKDKESKKINRVVESIPLVNLQDIGEKLKHLNWLIGDIRIKVCPLEKIS